jgi:multidrug efflux pump subunit AcrB
MKNTPGVKTYTSVIGFSLLSTVYNTYSAFFFVNFKPWSERTKPEESYAAIKAHLNRELGKIPEARAFAFSPPSIPGVGTAGGVTFVLEDRAGKDIAFLADNVSTSSWRRRRQEEGAHGPLDDSSCRRSRRSSSRWTGTRSSSRGSPWPTSTGRSSATWAASS